MEFIIAFLIGYLYVYGSIMFALGNVTMILFFFNMIESNYEKIILGEILGIVSISLAILLGMI